MPIGLKNQLITKVKKLPLEDHPHESHNHVQVYSSSIRVEVIISQNRLEKLILILQ